MRNINIRGNDYQLSHHTHKDRKNEMMIRIGDKSSDSTAGALFARIDGHSMFIPRIETNQAMRGKGIGSALLDAAHAYCASNGIGQLRLVATPEAVAAPAATAARSGSAAPSHLSIDDAPKITPEERLTTLRTEQKSSTTHLSH